MSIRKGAHPFTNFWTHNDVFCRRCDGDGELSEEGFADSKDIRPCHECAATGYEAIPWTELFASLRPTEPRKHPL